MNLDAWDTPLRIGIVGHSAQECEAIAQLVPDGTVVVRSEIEASLIDSERLEAFAVSRPEMILIESSSDERILQSIRLLHKRFPQSWILAIGGSSEPELIIATVRSGAREFINKPVTAESIAAAIGRFLDEYPRSRSEPGRIFAVTSAKGGSGATSVSINLAAAASELANTSVSLVDLTFPLGDVAAYLGLKPKYTLTDALKAASRLDPVLLETFMISKSGFSVLAGQAKIESVPSDVESAISRLLQILSAGFSHSFLDLSGAVSKEFLEASVESAESVVVVLTAEIPAVWRTYRLLDYLRDLRASSKVRVVLNRSQSFGEITKSDIEKTLNTEVYWELPNNYKSMINAINSGVPVVEENKSSLAKSYVEFVGGLTGMKVEKERGFLKSLFK